VLLQTFCPTHYAIQAAKAHDYRRFYEQEIRMRRRLRLPPFVHLIELTLMGTSRERVEAQAVRLGQALRDAIGRRRMQVLGPAPPRLASIRRRVRMCLLLKGARVEAMVALIRQVLGPGRTFGSLPVIVDVDPL
jgi:primosomal protein N' (replication factor Y)